MPRLVQALQGVKRKRAEQGGTTQVRLPITVDLLEKMRAVWSQEGSDDSRILWAAATICFFGFMRSGEITVPEGATFDTSTHLGIQDVAVDRKAEPQMVQITLKVSKTDPFRKGMKVYVGRTNSSICPVKALVAYIRDRGMREGPLFRWTNGQPLSRARFMLEVKRSLTQAVSSTRATVFALARPPQQQLEV